MAAKHAQPQLSSILELKATTPRKGAVKKMRAISTFARVTAMLGFAVALIASVSATSAGADSMRAPTKAGTGQKLEIVPWQVTGHTATTVTIHGHSDGLCGYPRLPGTVSIRWSGKVHGMRKAIITMSKDETAGIHAHAARIQLGVCISLQTVDATVKLGRPVREVALFDGSARPAERRSLCKGLIPEATPAGGVHCGYGRRD
jgi:hypothetical protein